MQTNFLTTMLIVLFTTLLFAQEAEKKPEFGWKKEMIGILNFSQSSFDNWSKGGENSWAWALDINGKLINDQEKFNWSNSAKLAYGNTQIGDEDAKKAADEISLESVFTYKLGLHLNPYFSFTARTQMTPGYEYTDDGKVQISNLFDPAYFTQGLGIGWNPGEKLKTRFGAALKETITETDIASERFNTGEKTRVEFGAEWVTDYETTILENIIYTTKLETFSNLESFEEIDLVWDNLLAAKVASYITASFNLKIVYDKDFNATRQLSQVLAVGLSYTFL